MRIQWPEGKKFAFSIFDDTDLAVPGNFEALYDLIGSLGFRTTKSVWTATGADLERRSWEGSTCDDPEYLREILKLQAAGFEIGYHNSYFRGLERTRIIEALDRFKDLFGAYPACMANHAGSAEGMYWGYDRLTGAVRSIYRSATRQFGANRHQGHIESSPHFWGDICQARIRYVRNFVFGDINSLGPCPYMPYHDQARPYVQAWYSASNAQGLPDFLKLMSEENQDRLEESGGACIVYTHFGLGFQEGNRVNPRFVELMKSMAARGGWFVPVTTLLDHIRSQRGLVQLDDGQRRRMEWRWLAHKIVAGAT